jgi:polyferredoxin
MASLKEKRAKVRHAALRAIRNDGQLYVRIRRVTLTCTVIVLYAVPFLGMARVDLVGGHHRAAFAATTNWLAGVGAMLVTALSFWAFTVVLRAVLGRVFCGFGCLVGQSARLGDNTQTAERSKTRVGAAWAAQLAASAVFAGGAVAWWADLTLLWRGTPAQALQVAALLLLGLGAAIVHGRYWRWDFCRQYCPIGLYYSVVGSGAPIFGVQYDATECNDCGLCDAVCPAQLEPRNLAKLMPDAGGLSIDELPGADHCLLCGDCVRACTVSTSKREPTLIPLRLGFRRDKDHAA